MKIALVIVAVIALVEAKPELSGGYSGGGASSGNGGGGSSPSQSEPEYPRGIGASGGGFGGGASSTFTPDFPQDPDNSQYTSQTFKNVYIFSAPEEPAEKNSNVIRVPGGNKHVNIVFVKTASSSSNQQTEVILPEQDEHKNLVYVLLKKGEASSDVKIRRPSAPRQQKPEVNFIRYTDRATSGQSFGTVPVQTPSSNYGVNF